MANAQKLVVPGFGVGTMYGTPVTIGLAPTSTLSITSSLVGEYAVTGLAAGVNLSSVSTANGVTDTIQILNGAPGRALLDGVSNFLVNTTTSVTIKIIGT
jgi:hypothetical protein